VLGSCLRPIFEIFLIIKRIQRDVVTNVRKFYSSVSVIHVRFLWIFTYLDRYWKIYQILHFTEIPVVGVDFFLGTDIQTDMTKQIVTFCNFTKAPKPMQQTEWPQVIDVGYRTLADTDREHKMFFRKERQRLWPSNILNTNQTLYHENRRVLGLLQLRLSLILREFRSLIQITMSNRMKFHSAPLPLYELRKC